MRSFSYVRGSGGKGRRRSYCVIASRVWNNVNIKKSDELRGNASACIDMICAIKYQIDCISIK